MTAAVTWESQHLYRLYTDPITTISLIQFICSESAQARASLALWAAKEAKVCTNCRTRTGPGKTPRAIKRPRTEMLAELNALIRAPPD